MSFDQLNQQMIFHWENIKFGMRDEFRSWSQILSRMTLLPLFVLVIAAMWDNSTHGDGISFVQKILYVSLGEVLAMTHSETRFIEQGQSVFAISLSRPQSWVLTLMSGAWGRTIAKRLVFLLSAFLVLFFLVENKSQLLIVCLRFMALIPFLTVLDAVWIWFFACAYLVTPQARYFRLPFNKLVLALGGVMAPLFIAPSPWKEWLLAFPFADAIFQPCWFAMTGEFWGMNPWEWGLRFGTQVLVLGGLSALFYSYARKHFQGQGG